MPDGDAPEPFLSISSDTLPPTNPMATRPAIDMTNVRREIVCLLTGVCAGTSIAAIVAKCPGVAGGKGGTKVPFSVFPEEKGPGVK